MTQGTCRPTFYWPDNPCHQIKFFVLHYGAFLQRHMNNWNLEYWFVLKHYDVRPRILHSYHLCIFGSTSKASTRNVSGELLIFFTLSSSNSFELLQAGFSRFFLRQRVKVAGRDDIGTDQSRIFLTLCSEMKKRLWSGPQRYSFEAHVNKW